MGDIIKKIAEKYNLNEWVVTTIVNHPFLFTKYIISDTNNVSTVMIPYFGKFTPRANVTVETKIDNENYVASRRRKNKVKI